MFIPFNVLFEEENSQTVQYQGNTIYRFYKINKTGKYNLRFSNILSNSKYPQCILILFNECKGKMFFCGKEKAIPQGPFPKIIFWEDVVFDSFEIGFSLEEGSLIICNGSDPIGTKEICHSLTHSCAMMIETINENKFRFLCNDHENDDDFNDLFFDMEITDEQSSIRWEHKNNQGTVL